MRFQNIDAYEDFFGTERRLCAFVKRSSHNYPTIEGKNFDVFPKNSTDTMKKFPHLIATKSCVFGV